MHLACMCFCLSSGNSVCDWTPLPHKLDTLVQSHTLLPNLWNYLHNMIIERQSPSPSDRPPWIISFNNSFLSRLKRAMNDIQKVRQFKRLFCNSRNLQSVFVPYYFVVVVFFAFFFQNKVPWAIPKGDLCHELFCVVVIF